MMGRYVDALRKKNIKWDDIVSRMEQGRGKSISQV